MNLEKIELFMQNMSKDETITILKHSTLWNLKEWNASETSKVLKTLLSTIDIEYSEGWDLRLISNFVSIVKASQNLVEDFGYLKVDREKEKEEGDSKEENEKENEEGCELNVESFFNPSLLDLALSILDPSSYPMMIMKIEEEQELKDAPRVKFTFNVCKFLTYCFFIKFSSDTSSVSQLTSATPSFLNLYMKYVKEISLNEQSIKEYNLALAVILGNENLVQPFEIIYVEAFTDTTKEIPNPEIASVRNRNHSFYIDTLVLTDRFDYASKYYLRSPKLAERFINLNKIGMLTSETITSLKEALEKSDMSISQLKEIFTISPTIKELPKCLKFEDLDVISDLGWKISNMPPCKMCYYLGFPIQFGTPGVLIQRDAILALSKAESPEKYVEEMFEKFKSMNNYPIFSTIKKVNNERNTLFNEFNTYSPFDRITYLDDEHLFEFTREEWSNALTKLRSGEQPKNHYNKQAFPRAFIREIQGREHIAQEYGLPSAQPLVDLYSDLMEKASSKETKLPEPESGQDSDDRSSFENFATNFFSHIFQGLRSGVSNGDSRLEISSLPGLSIYDFSSGRRGSQPSNSIPPSTSVNRPSMSVNPRVDNLGLDRVPHPQNHVPSVQPGSQSSPSVDVTHSIRRAFLPGQLPSGSLVPNIPNMINSNPSTSEGSMGSMGRVTSGQAILRQSVPTSQSTSHSTSSPSNIPEPLPTATIQNTSSSASVSELGNLLNTLSTFIGSDFQNMNAIPDDDDDDMYFGNNSSDDDDDDGDSGDSGDSDDDMESVD